MAEAGREEAYVLRFVDAALAARVRATLAEDPDADPADAHMELDFDGEEVVFFFFLRRRFVKQTEQKKTKKLNLDPSFSLSLLPPKHTEKQLTPAGEARVGTFTIAGERYPVFLLDSPSVIEAYSTLDDVNLVKTADVGQIVLVARPGTTAPPPGAVLTPAAAASLQQQLGPTGGAAPCPPGTASWESRDGLTPPMSDARARHFARLPVAPRDAVAAAEAAILKIAHGSAPDGVTFEDVEEEYAAPNEDGTGGGWKPVRKGHKAKPIAVAAAEIAKKKKEVKARARQAALAKGMTHTEARKAAVAAAARAAAALQSGYGGASGQEGGGGGGGGGGSGGSDGDDDGGGDEGETGDEEDDE